MDTFPDIPDGAAVTIRENAADGYTTYIQENGTTIAADRGYTYENMKTDHAIDYYKTTGPSLPRTGGTEIYTLLGAGLMLSAVTGGVIWRPKRREKK